MAQLKYWDGSQWVNAVVGAQGPVGPQGPAGTGDVTSTVTNTFTTNQIISGSTTTDLLRITQTGAGNALVVEDSANPDSTPFVVDANGSVGVGVSLPLASLHILAGTATGVSPAAGGRMFIDGNNANMWIDIAGATTSEVGLRFGDSGGIQRGRVGYSNTGDFLDFYTAGSERMRIDSAGRLGIGAQPTAGRGLNYGISLTGNTQPLGIFNAGQIQSDATNGAIYFSTWSTTAASAGAIPLVVHYQAQQGTIGASSSITTQVGFVANSTMTGGTNNWGFRGELTAATGRYNLYMDGSAPNFLSGRLGVGAGNTSGAMTVITNTTAADKVLVVKGAASQTGIPFEIQNSAGAATFYVGTTGNVIVANGTNSVARLEIGEGRTADADSWLDLIGDTTYTDYGLRILRSSGANGNTALYHRGTGGIYLIAQDAGVVAFSTSNTERMRINPTGSVAIGAGTFAGVTLRLGRNITGAAFSQAMFIDATIQADVTTRADMVWSNPTVAASVTSSGINHFYASSPAIGAGSTITSVAGYVAESNLGNNYSGTVTNAYAFMGNIAAGTNRWNLFMGGTATNYLAGRLGVGAGINSGAQVLLQSTAATDRTLIVKGAASQTALLTEWQNSAGTVLAYVAADGSSSFTEGDQNIIATSIFS